MAADQGYISSVAWSPMLNMWLGLALLSEWPRAPWRSGEDFRWRPQHSHVRRDLRSHALRQGEQETPCLSNSHAFHPLPTLPFKAALARIWRARCYAFSAPSTTIVTVIARKGKAKALFDTLTNWRGARVQWAGADQYFVLEKPFAMCGRNLRALLPPPTRAMAGWLSGSRGRRCAKCLCKGTPVDLHEYEFEIGRSALTQWPMWASFHANWEGCLRTFGVPRVFGKLLGVADERIRDTEALS